MRILIFHPTLLPPKNYGGVERVVLWLARGLKERGHEVWVAALKGSQLPEGVQLLEVEKKAYSSQEIEKLLPKSFDLVHFMAPLSPDVWNALSFPRILTVHGNGQPGEKFPEDTVFLSQDHARRHQAEFFIYNGVDPSEFIFKERKESWFLFLSKTNWSVKNLSGAISLCKKAKVPLTIAGGERPYSTRLGCFFSRSMKWAGAVSGPEKARLLSQAKALLFPVKWPEPFGLVVVEAFLSGTPVLASPKGSLLELIPKTVGSLPQTEAEWIDILSQDRLPWKAEACRNWALEKFHYGIMAKNYEAAYETVISGKKLHKTNPVAGNWRLM